MPYTNSSCNNSYSQPSYPSYSHPYVHHQNAHAYNHGYPSQHPALTYPGYGYSGGYSGQSYCAPRYSSPSYASPSYGTPNVFSIIKTSPDLTDDNVCALNSYDTLCLEAGTPDHLTITGDKTNKKVTFALKQVVTSVAGDDNAATGQVLAPPAKRTSGQVTVNGTTAVPMSGDIRLADTSTGALATRIMLTDNFDAASGTPGTITIVQSTAGAWSIVSDDANDTRVFNYLLVN